MQNTHIADTFGQLIKQAQSTNQRRCLVLAGDRDWCYSALQQIFAQYALPNTLVVSKHWTNQINCSQTTVDHALDFLGQEFNHAIIDCHDGIDPNVLGAVSGTIVGGGILTLTLPTLHELPVFKDPQKSCMTVWPHTIDKVGNRFLRRLANLITASSDITLIEQHNDKLPTHQERYYNESNTAGYLQDDLCVTQDQVQALEAIEHVANGHRHRPLVLTANRGRGKSAILGIAAARLLAIPGHNVIITGPRLSATYIVFKHVRALLPDGNYSPGKFEFGQSSLVYMAADRLCQELPACRILLVDEAAAVPTPMLETLVRHYSRIVFSTTTYGYEGTGLGFAIRFTEKLNRLTPGWRRIEMQLPVRWAPNDPVENFIFETLCLDAAPYPVTQHGLPENISIEKINRDRLVEDNKLLSEIFGLLILAHYQTQPRDLRYLLDGINLDLYVATQDDHVVGAAIVAREGGLDPETADAVYRSQRRVQGHMLAQTLEAFIGIQFASRQQYWRVIRIAVHPGYRRHGVGSQLLAAITSQAKNEHVDMIGSIFGASQEVLAFWQHNQFDPVHIGLKRNASHGTNSITMLKPVSKPGNPIYQLSNAKFQREWVDNLAERLQSLDIEIVLQVFCALNPNGKLSLHVNDWQEITIYAESSRQYEHAALAISSLVTQVFLALDVRQLLDIQDTKLLVAKVLQRKPWSQVVAETRLDGKQQARQHLRQVISTLIHSKLVLEKLTLTEIQ